MIDEKSTKKNQLLTRLKTMRYRYQNIITKISDGTVKYDAGRQIKTANHTDFESAAASY